MSTPLLARTTGPHAPLATMLTRRMRYLVVRTTKAAA